MKTTQAEMYRKMSFPKMRRPALDAGRLGRNKHIMHGLMEIDVTKALDLMDDHIVHTGDRISFTAYIINCLGKAIEQHTHMHAYLNWRKQLVIYDNVNIVTMIESVVDGNKVPVPYLFKNVNQSSLLEVHEEIRKAQTNLQATEQSSRIRSFYHLPRLVRRLMSRLALRLPGWFRNYASSVMVTSVGMFGDTAGWGIPKPCFTLTVTIGGITEKPWVSNHLIAVRDILHLTLSINHDIIDGAPAARFTKYLKQLIESGYGLIEYERKQLTMNPSLN